jgi:tetratricopeptide (TPR) repeat protein
MIKQQKTIKSKTLVFSVFLLSFLVSCNFGIAQSKSKKSTKLSDFQINQRKVIFLNAFKERTLGNYNEAEKLYKDVLAIDPEHDASMYELARIYLTKNRSEDAVKLLEKACELSPDNEEDYRSNDT